MPQTKPKLLSKIVLSATLPLAVLAGAVIFPSLASAAAPINNVAVSAIKKLFIRSIDSLKLLFFQQEILTDFG